MFFHVADVIDSHFDNGCCNQEIQLLFSELIHDVFFFAAGQLAMEDAYLKIFESGSTQDFRFLNSGFKFHLVRFFD